MQAVEFDVLHVIAGRPQLCGVRTSTGLDRQLLVDQTVRNEHLRVTFLREDRHETAGKGDHAARDVAVRYADRQRVTRAIRKPGERQVVAIYPVARRDRLERLLQALEVGAAAA